MLPRSLNQVHTSKTLCILKLAWHYYTLHFNGHFPGGPGLAGIRMSIFWIILKLRVIEVMVTTGATRTAKFQPKCHHRQTDTLFFSTGRMPFMSPNQQRQSTEGKTYITTLTGPITCSRYLSQLMYSRSFGSCSRCVLMYCHSALMMTGRVCVWMPSNRARRKSSLNCIGCTPKMKPVIINTHRYQYVTKTFFTTSKIWSNTGTQRLVWLIAV